MRGDDRFSTWYFTLPHKQLPVSILFFVGGLGSYDPGTVFDACSVKKLWWNPNDPAMQEISDLARDEGVTSSPFFILYEDGKAVKAGYAFPDEKGDGMRTNLTFSGPNARDAITAVTAESIPPDSPRMALLNPSLPK